MKKINRNWNSKHRILFTFCILLWSTIYCDEKKERNINIENSCDFFNIKFGFSGGRFEPTACSPTVDDEFRGIKIAAPDKIVLSEDVPFVLCGTMRLNARYEFQFHSTTYELTLVIENVTRRQVWSCNFLGPNSTLLPINPDVTIEDIHPEEVSTSWFNVDIFRYLPDMPREPGEYTVYATLGDYTSNTVIVKLEEK